MKRITHTIALFLVFVSLLAGSPPASADAPAATLKADFVMTRKVAVLKEPLTSRGRLALGGPGRLRFETVHPSRSVLVINGGNGWLHYPELGVTKRFDIAADPVMGILSEQLAALSSGDFEALASKYRITDTDGKKTLVPTDPAIGKLFSALHVTLREKGVVNEVEMVSTSGDTTRIAFQNVVRGGALDPGLFADPGATSGAGK